MKQKLLYSILLFLPFTGVAQDAPFKISPFVNGTTSIKDGLIETGPEFTWQKDEDGRIFSIRPSVRMPLTSKTDNALQIDRYSSTWRGILALQYTTDKTTENGKASRHSFAGQVEYGSTAFKFYPTGTKTNEQKNTNSSYAGEIKYIGFFSKGAKEAKQWSSQARLRYSYDWKAGDEVGVVQPVNSNGVVATTNMIIEAPSVKPTLSPAISLQYYTGKGNFSYAPTIYYDFTGSAGSNDPFSNLNRLRMEYWIFFYPSVAETPNVKIGLTPFVSIRTAGTDDFKKVEYGGMITLKFGSSFLQFF